MHYFTSQCYCFTFSTFNRYSIDDKLLSNKSKKKLIITYFLHQHMIHNNDDHKKVEPVPEVARYKQDRYTLHNLHLYSEY
jgi:hypothetical protein